MSDGKVQDTVLETLTDDLIGNFFDGSVNSNNVVLPDAPTEGEPAEPKPEKKDKPSKDKGFTSPFQDFDTNELIGDILKDDDEADEPEPAKDDEKRPVGRPPKSKDSEFDFNTLLEDGVLSPFEDDAPIKSVTDLKELIKANRAADLEKGKEEALQAYKENLPDTINQILNYVENGGQDFDNFLKALGQARQITDLTVDTDNGRKEIIRQYYALQDWTPEEINEEIESLIDLGEEKLTQVASKLKPKLDKMQEEVVASKMEEAANIKKQQEAAQKAYVTNVFNSLKKGKLGDLKITKEEQKDIYAALVEERYPTPGGGVTNRLGALLDKIQFVEQDYDLLSKITLYITDPKGFENKLRDQIKSEVTAEQVKKIKTEQGLKTGDTGYVPQAGTRVKRLDTNFKNPFQ